MGVSGSRRLGPSGGGAGTGQEDPPDLGERYTLLGLIGAGGMGEVYRVQDHLLGRVVAMKVLRDEIGKDAETPTRFLEEAQATAQLQHPGIVPVHDMGQLPDGRRYFTMKEVRGRTLSAVIGEVHRASMGESWEVAPSGYTFRRLVDAFTRVCEAVAYAHNRGVTHRDLKPANIMVGQFGEVLVLDWGLARVGEAPDGQPVVTPRLQGALLTQYGAVSGTPAYMSPEQARGQTATSASDVYSLGAILYEILSGRPPFEGPNAGVVLAQVLSGAPLPVGRRGLNLAEMVTATLLSVDAAELDESPRQSHEPPQAGPPIPQELKEICERAMARDPHQRFGDAEALAAAITTWLEDTRKRERALELVVEAEGSLARARELEQEASGVRSRSAELLKEIETFRPAESRIGVWTLEDEAIRLELEADHLEAEGLHKLQGALTYVPDLLEAHNHLAGYYCRRHQQAEARRDRRASTHWEVLLRAHDRGRYQHYLKGEGLVSVLTDPPGARITIYRYVEKNRRLELDLFSQPGYSPLRRLTLPVGSYVCTLEAPGRTKVTWPFVIERESHWDGVPPEGGTPPPVYLPREVELGPGEIYVPGGWFWRVPDPAWLEVWPRHRTWVDNFVISRYPITNAEYLIFLNALVDDGLEDVAIQAAPQERSSRGESPIIFHRDAQGHFCLGPDMDGDVWEPDWPVTMISWEGAARYARWRAEHTGQPWRLPFELEWEKAVRGVDGRFFPWGDDVDPGTIDCTESQRGRPSPRPVHSFPLDSSPYGVGSAVGGVRVWLGDLFLVGGPRQDGGRAILEESHDMNAQRSARGGGWSVGARQSRISARGPVGPRARIPRLGFRVARPLKRPDSA